MRDHVQRGLDALRQSNGLYVASPSNTYHYLWIRDICYIALSELQHDNGRFEATYHSLLDILKKYEWKLLYHAKQKPVYPFEYIHPRYRVDTLEESHEPWGNAQNDAIGALLFGIGAGMRRNKQMLRDETDQRIVELLVEYLATLCYYEDADNGIWEENLEVHASSVGACVAGLLAIQPYVDVPPQLIQTGLQHLFALLPNESVTKHVDLALLSLVYPYRLLPHDMAEQILLRVETELLRAHGVIRYHGDKYYSVGDEEAQWCMGVPWLGLGYMTLGNMEKAKHYLDRSTALMTDSYAIPELYVANGWQPNENTPLGWAMSLWLVLDECMMDVAHNPSDGV